MNSTKEVDMNTNLVVRNIDEAEVERGEIPQTVLQQPNRQSLAEVLSNMPNVGEDADFNCRNDAD